MPSFSGKKVRMIQIELKEKYQLKKAKVDKQQATHDGQQRWKISQTMYNIF